MEPQVLRVPILTPQNALPTRVKVLDSSLPERLSAANVATKTDLLEIDGVGASELDSLLSALRAEVLSEVNVLLEAAKAKTYIFVSDFPVAQATLQHNFDWDGPLNITIWSLDLKTVYEAADTFVLDNNTVQLAFEDPITFQAIVSI